MTDLIRLRRLPRYATLALFLGLAAVTSLGGCAKIGEAIDCQQLCETLRTCVDGDLSVRRCSDRCEDQTDTSAMRNRLDDCTDCLDQGWACAEIREECPMCQSIIEDLI